jgi:hypothetical protein
VPADGSECRVSVPGGSLDTFQPTPLDSLSNGDDSDGFFVFVVHPRTRQAAALRAVSALISCRGGRGRTISFVAPEVASSPPM